MRNFNFNEHSITGLVGMRLTDELFENVGYDLKEKKLFVKVGGKHFQFVCQEIIEEPDYKCKGGIVNYI